MVRLSITSDSIHLDLTTTEKIMALVCCCAPSSNLVNVSKVTASDNIWSEMKGCRVGTGIPFSLMFGRKVYWEGKDFVAVYYGTPGVVIEFTSGPYKRWLFSCEDYKEIAAELQRRVEVLGQARLVANTH